MININKKIEGSTLTLSIFGNLDTVTTPEFEKEIDILRVTENITELVIDLQKLQYTSSAGLRAFLRAQKVMQVRNGSVRIINANKTVLDVLKMTGFDSAISVE